MSWGWNWYPKPKPRRPANGIKAQSKQFGKTWWASKWRGALERLVDSARLSRGRSYARSGQVLNLDIHSGRVESRVQGSRSQPYKVKIGVAPLASKEWDKVADAMAEQAIFAAKLLAGEMPSDIEQAFAAAGVSLFPASRGDLKTNCSCPDSANPCKHVAAVYYLLGEQFDADPFLLFRLRGKSKDDIMAMLRARRSTAEPVQAPAATEGNPPVIAEEPATPLEASLDRFWVCAESLDDLAVSIQAPTVEAVPVKRLGVPGFWHSKADFLALMTQAYQAITQEALDVALGVEGK